MERVACVFLQLVLQSSSEREASEAHRFYSCYIECGGHRTVSYFCTLKSKSVIYILLRSRKAQLSAVLPGKLLMGIFYTSNCQYVKLFHDLFGVLYLGANVAKNNATTMPHTFLFKGTLVLSVMH